MDKKYSTTTCIVPLFSPQSSVNKLSKFYKPSLHSAVENNYSKNPFFSYPGGHMERAAPEAHLLRPVRSHHRLDALQGEARHTVQYSL